MTITKPGIYDIEPEVYHADPCPTPSLSASIASTLVSRSPAHARVKHPRLNPDFEPENKAIFDIGSAAHHMVLRADIWREEIAICDADSWRTKAAREFRDAAREAGRHPLLRADYERLERMVVELEQHPNAKKVFADGKPEQSFFWRDPKTDIWMRCRPDWMPNKPTGLWPDYKTTTDANPRVWDRRFCLDHGGLLRAAFYEEGIRQCCGVDHPTLCYVVQETSPPFAIVVRVAEPHSQLMQIGRAMLRKAIDTWAECLSTDKWPSYELVGMLVMPGWAETQMSQELADWMKGKPE